MKCSEKSCVNAPLISFIFENTESYGNNPYIVVACPVYKNINLLFVKKKHMILA